MSSGAITSLETGEPVPLAWRQELLARAHSFQAKSGQMIIAQESHSTDVYFISQGRIQVSLISENGRESIFRDIGMGHIFGELSALDEQPRSVSVTAIEDCKLAQLSAKNFAKFLTEFPAANRWMHKQLVTRIRSLTEKTFQLSTMAISSRVQTELVRMGRDTGIENDQTTIRNFPTHAKLAAKLGTHREAITKELRLLSSEGILQQSGRKLDIISMRKLETLLSKTLQ